AISNKLKSLITIAGQVQMGGKQVTSEAVAAARDLGATDIEIHDTVLIAAAFCMFNRYVDGLATTAPDDQRIYDMIGKSRAETGYLTPPMPVAMNP
ncbi:MAG: carboxymuconolactone decarboxylase family protein, partial [Bacteroidetes bacterium]|nr:carboxymuconolactone decarboxylase family protein [Bacteroidota bacterium]